MDGIAAAAVRVDADGVGVRASAARRAKEWKKEQMKEPQRERETEQGKAEDTHMIEPHIMA